MNAAKERSVSFLRRPSMGGTREAGSKLELALKTGAGMPPLQGAQGFRGKLFYRKVKPKVQGTVYGTRKVFLTNSPFSLTKTILSLTNRVAFPARFYPRGRQYRAIEP